MKRDHNPRPNDNLKRAEQLCKELESELSKEELRFVQGGVAYGHETQPGLTDA